MNACGQPTGSDQGLDEPVPEKSRIYRSKLERDLSFANIMCFTLLLGSWLIFHSARASSSSVHVTANYNITMENVTLIFYKKPGIERAGSRFLGELVFSLQSLERLLNGLETIPGCEDSDDKPICLNSTSCPGQNETWNPTAKRDTYRPICSTTIIYREEGETKIRGVNETSHESGKPTTTEVWCFGILAVAIISLSGLFGGILSPLMKSKYYQHVMRILIGLAVGTLCATSALQLIPQGFCARENDASQLMTAVTLLISFWVMYLFEVICKIIFKSSNENKKNVENSTQETFIIKTEINKEIILEQAGLLPTLNADIETKSSLSPPMFSSRTSLHTISTKENEHAHQHVKMGGLAPVAWMILVGDGLHNFVDGMSIGAGFTQSLSTGLAISIAIACEEFPHELGDFAILVNSGLPVKKAMMCNFLSAITAFIGLILGILLGELDANTYIFTFSGGLFLYIALTNLLPELNDMVAEGLKISKKSALLILLQQNCGILIGFCLLYIISAIPISLQP